MKYTFGPEDIAGLSGCIVYAFWKEDVVLYVGSSGDGLGRAFHSSHKKAQVARKQADRLEIIGCTDRTAAYEIEHKMIWDHKPMLNARGIHREDPIWEELRKRNPDRVVFVHKVTR